MLPENYYLSNFDSLIAFVVDTYREILSTDELAWSKSVVNLPVPARRLYVRLLSRQGNTFRLGKLKYPEIEDLEQAAHTLAAVGLANPDAPGDLEQILPTLTRPELMKLPELHDMKSASRADMDARLVELNSAEVLCSLLNIDRWIEIQHTDTFELFVMCYFGNRYQDLTDFVLRDLGHQNYEKYAIDQNTRAFQTRDHIEAHWRYFQCQASLEQVDITVAEELLGVNDALPDSVNNNNLIGDMHLIRRVSRFRNQLARQLERLQESALALSLYQCSQLPPSRERQVRILCEQEKIAEALVIAEAMVVAPIDDSELRFAERQVPKLKKTLGLRVAKARVFKPITTKLTLQSGPDNESDRVELRALQYYQRTGRCYYSENALVRAVLGLFIWDLMFMPIDGAFHHPFQSGPSDLMQPEFVSRRQSAFDARWKELDDPLRFAARVWQHWEEKRGLSNVLVHWSRLSEELLSDALIRIPVAHWRALFNRLLADLRHNGKGFPDLVLFPNGEGYEFIEIKGPGDALQQHQRRWMQYFTQHKIPHRVVNIRYALTEPDD